MPANTLGPEPGRLKRHDVAAEQKLLT
jgi:hypothetical protein